MVESNTWHNIISVGLTHIYVYQIHTPLKTRYYTFTGWWWLLLTKSKVYL